MGYIANVPLKFGHGFIMPGESVPVQRGRNYASMLRLGQITLVRDPGAPAPDPGPGTPTTVADAVPGADVTAQTQQIDELKRSELDRVAQEAGVTEPEKLGTKADVIAAIHEATPDRGGE